MGLLVDGSKDASSYTANWQFLYLTFTGDEWETIAIPELTRTVVAREFQSATSLRFTPRVSRESFALDCTGIFSWQAMPVSWPRVPSTFKRIDYMKRGGAYAQSPEAE